MQKAFAKMAAMNISAGNMLLLLALLTHGDRQSVNVHVEILNISRSSEWV